jgi:adenosylcobinamide-phosphate synthase
MPERWQYCLPLARGDVVEVRRQLSKIVERDTDNLPPGEVARGAVETVAENTVDGVVAPLFYAFIGGAPLAMAYKAVNTLDSMIGYRDERHCRLGWAAARLDDAVNYLPARITGLIFF